MSKKLSAQQQQIIEQLAHIDLEVVLDSIKSVNEIGNEQFIKPLIACYQNYSEEEVKNSIRGTLCNLHHTKAMEAYLEEITNQNPENVDAGLLSVLWQGKFTIQDHLLGIVKCGVSNDFAKMMELNTILENSIEVFEEEAVLESQLYLKAFIHNNPESPVLDQLNECEVLLKNLELVD